MQEYLGSMEGAVLSGKLAANAIIRDYPVIKGNEKEKATVGI
jgi:15-cis-phytoene desaturase